jgi:hypothetical protein
MPLLALPLLDLLLPVSPESALANAANAPVELLARAVLMLSAALALHTLALGLAQARLPLASAAQVLLVVFSFTFVLMRTDASAQLTERQAQRAAESWTDEALGSLPGRSLLMVRSEPAAWRLWAASSTRGERPDLTVLPLPLLDRGDTAARLLELEPHLAPLIRELRVTGRPSEFALSSLADARPLYVEFDPRWDHRLLEHLLPRPFWMRFTPHALGRSDRTAALEAGRAPFERVLDRARHPLPDPATLEMLAACAREQAVMLAAVGDHQSALGLAAALSELPSEAEFVATLRSRLENKQRGVDWVALLE